MPPFHRTLRSAQLTSFTRNLSPKSRTFSLSVRRHAEEQRDSTQSVEANSRTPAPKAPTPAPENPTSAPAGKKSGQLPFLPLVAIFLLGTGSFYYLIKSREGQGYKPHQTLPASAKEEFQRK